MGGTAEGLFRVRDEILRSRRERGLLLASLEEETRERRAAVSRMLARFSWDLAEQAREMQDNPAMARRVWRKRDA